uniref:Large terminase n=1 Tax=Pseudomonas phage Nican01 TaxID=3138540 RepID=A0AAU6W0D9_9CAUD
MKITNAAPSNLTPLAAKIGLHPKQAEVFLDTTRFRVVVAGRRWGKTALSKTEMIQRAKIPNQKIWYIAPTYRMAKQIMWNDLKASIPRKWIIREHETEMSITLRNGSIIECKGADNPDTLRGVGLNFVVMDEFQDIRPDTWTTIIRPTLAKDRGEALFIGTPKAYNQLYEVYQFGQDPARKAWSSYQFPTITSPFIPESEIIEARRDMDPRTFRQEFEASFETMSGRVYYPFDRHVHCDAKVKFNPGRPIYVGVDFNIDPMSACIMQPQTNGELWVIDEIFLHNSNTLEVCEELEKRYWRYMSQITIFPDPAGAARQHARGESDLEIFRQKGFNRIKFRRKHPLIADRVNSVNRLLQDAAGKITLKVNPGCTNVVQSLEQTLYKAGSRDIDKAASMEHITDAMGYCIELEHPVKKIVLVGHSI